MFLGQMEMNDTEFHAQASLYSLTSLVFNFAVGYNIAKVQAIQRFNSLIAQLHSL